MCVCVSYFDSSIGGVSHSLQQLVILWIKRDGEGTVNDPPCGNEDVINEPNLKSLTIDFLQTHQHKKKKQRSLIRSAYR